LDTLNLNHYRYEVSNVVMVALTYSLRLTLSRRLLTPSRRAEGCS